jgi:acyl dehydratase
MALDVSAVGRTTEPRKFTYGWKDVVLYALGVGATRDDELEFVYEKHGPKVLPTFAVIPSYEVAKELFQMAGGNYEGIVHLRQDLRLHTPLAPEGTLTTVGSVRGVYDMKRFAQSVFRTESFDEKGTLVATNDWGILFRFDGGFGGEKPPAEPRIKIPDAAPVFETSEAIPKEQALLYRLTGDLNPLHADPELARSVGFESPILHGLATFGYVGRSVVRHACAGDPTRLVAIGGQFRKPVLPGETLLVTGHAEAETDRVLLRAAVDSKPDEFVFSNSYAEIGPSR